MIPSLLSLTDRISAILTDGILSILLQTNPDKAIFGKPYNKYKKYPVFNLDGENC